MLEVKVFVGSLHHFPRVPDIENKFYKYYLSQQIVKKFRLDTYSGGETEETRSVVTQLPYYLEEQGLKLM